MYFRSINIQFQSPTAAMKMSIFEQNRRINECGYKHNGKPIRC